MIDNYFKHLHRKTAGQERTLTTSPKMAMPVFSYTDTVKIPQPCPKFT